MTKRRGRKTSQKGRRPKKAGLFGFLVGRKTKGGRIKSKARMGKNGISFT